MRFWCLFWAICVWVFSAPAQDHHYAFGYSLKSKRNNYTRIPFSLHSNLILVKLRLDKKDSITMVLDTGVSSNIITNQETAQRFGLEYSRKVVVNGAGEGGPLTANVSIGHYFEARDLKAEKQNLVVLDKDVLNLSEYLGVKVDGIFGHDLFSNFVVTIDFERKELRVYPHQKFKYKKGMGPRYPIVLTSTKPYTDMLMIVKNGKKLPTRLVIDTGAGHALLLDSKSENIDLPSKLVRANLGRGLNGEINGNIGRIPKIQFGEREIKNVVASYPDSISFSTKFGNEIIERNGSIGMELLRRFVITFNYHEGYMAMRPIRDQINDAFERDMSGLDVRAKGSNFERFIVEAVDENSPAFEAGMHVGDEIVFLDGQNIKELTISEVYKVLSRKEGKKVSIIARRNGTLVFFDFRLRRLI